MKYVITILAPGKLILKPSFYAMALKDFGGVAGNISIFVSSSAETFRLQIWPKFCVIANKIQQSLQMSIKTRTA